MTRSDPAYDFFREDAEAQGFTVLADYFRHYGIVPPAPYGRPKYKDRELAQHNDLDRLTRLNTWTGDKSIYKSWGEPGATITISRNSGDGDDNGATT